MNKKCTICGKALRNLSRGAAFAGQRWTSFQTTHFACDEREMKAALAARKAASK